MKYFYFEPGKKILKQSLYLQFTGKFIRHSYGSMDNINQKIQLTL